MKLIQRKRNIEIWAQFDQEAQVYELFFDNQGESYTGWAVDSLKDAQEVAKYIFEEQTAS